MKKLLLGLFIGLIATAYAAVPITFPINGGTGTNCKPTLGQVLVGNSSGTYNCQATSTLGISGSLSGGTTGWLSYWTSPTTLSAFATGTPGQLLIASSTSASGFGWTATSSLGISGGSGSGNSAWTIGSGLIYNATSTDKVGIGTSTPAYPLTVVGTSTFDNLVPSKINGTIVVDGIKYPQTNAGIQSAINDCASTNCGKVITPRFSATITTPITLPSGITLEGASTTLITSMSGVTDGIFSLTNKNDIKITGYNFIVNGSSTAVISFGHQNLQVIGNTFSGTNGGSGGNGVVALFGSTASAPFNNTLVENNIFKDMTASSRTIYLYSRNGNIITNTRILNNYFENDRGPAIYLDDYDFIRNTLVSNNQFRNLKSGVSPTNPAVAVFAGIALLNNLIHDLVVTNNQYTNTATSVAQQGFVYFYSAVDTVISGNTMIGAWSTSTNVAGPAIAPGRTSTPVHGVIISNNYIEGFDAAWDPDSMDYVEVANNVVKESGTCFNTGYGGTQNYINIHDNLCQNTNSRQYQSFILFGNTSPRKLSFRNNTYVDTNNPATTTSIMLFTGNYDFSDVVVTGNRFYVPYGTSSLETTRFMVKELGSEKLPLVVNNNEVETGSSTTWNSQYFSNGNILFLAATTTGTGTTTNGVMTGDSNFTWDNVNKRLGIGSSTPISRFVVSGGTSTLATTTITRLGVNVTNPSQALEVAGTIFSSGASAAYRITQGNSYFFDNSSTVHFARYDNTNSLDGVLINGFGGTALGAGGTEKIRVNSTGLGVGTTSFAQLLSVAGNMRLTGAFFDGSNASGTYGMVHISTGTSTQWVSTSSLGIIGGGSGNSAFTIGNGVIYNATTTDNVGIGTTTPLYKLDVAGFINTNNASGYKQGGNTILFATSSLTSTFVGVGTGNTTHTGDANTGVGQRVLDALTSGFRNTAMGVDALTAVNSGNTHTAIGSEAMLSQTGGSANTAIGYQSLRLNLTGDNNTALGVGSLSTNTSFGNTGLGSQAGTSVTTGNSNIFIGRDAGNSSAQLTSAVNSIAIGYQAYTTASNQAVFGSSTILTTILNGNVGMGSTTPNSKLSIQGSGTTNPLTVASSTGTTLFQILANGNVGIGSSTPSRLLTVTSTSSMRDILPETTNTYSLGASSTRWASLWSGIVNIGTSTWSLGQTGTRFGIFPQAQLGGTEAFSILSDGKVGIGSTTPSDTLSVNGSINVTGSVKVNGTPISDGVGTSTADYIISKNGANVVVYDTTANTNTSYSDFDDAMNAIIPTATSTGRSNVVVRSGIYAINSSILYSGNGTVYSTSLNLTGAGGTSTLLVINTPKGFNFSQRAKVNFSNLGIAVGANTNTAFYASTTSGVMASIMDSSFSDIIAVSTTTGHTGYVFDFIGDFRNNYENIRAYQVGNLWRSQNNYSNAQFINGDSNWYGFNFCEINNSSTTASGVCWELKGNNGQVNQVIFGDINGISNDSGAGSNDVFLKLTNATRISMPSGGNAEQFATTTQVVSGNGIFLAFTKYVTQTTSATGKAFLDTSSTAYNVNVQCKEVELSAATIVWSDKNTLAGQSNRLSGINGGNCIMTDNGGSVVWATSTRSSIEGIYNNIDGSTSLAAWKVLGDKIVMNFSATMNSYLSYMGGAMRWIMLGTERMTLTDAGNLGLGSTTPIRTLSVVGSQSLSGAFYDSLNSAGGAGECLTSTGSATDWASCGGGGGLSGGSTGLLALWSSATTLAQSLFMDNGTVTGIGATSTSARFNIASTTGDMMWAFGTNGQLSIATTTATTSIETGILGQIKLSALTYAGRDVLATKIASSSSSGIQAALWDKQITRWGAGATNGVMLGSSITALTTATALAPTAVNKYTTFRRSRWASVVTTANQQVGLRTDAQFFRSATSTNSGWFYKATFGIDNYTANDRFFVGLSSCTTACLTGTTTLTNLANTIGFGVEGSTSQFVFLTNDGSGAISTTTISGLPTLATNNGYHVYMYNPPTSSVVYWRIDDVNTGAMVAEGNVTTNLPANNTFMTAQVACSNALNAAANACQIGLASLYIEQEK